MTERTFRDPSPIRPASSHGPYTRHDEAPPVPALPKNILQSQPPVSAQQKAARRAVSVDPPDRVSSPPPRLLGGRGVSLDRQAANSRPMEPVPKPRVASSSTVGALERPGSRNSVNFSRPMSPQNSPPTAPLATARVKSPPPSKSAGSSKLSDGEAGKMLGSIQETDAAAVKKKKKVAVKTSAGDDHPSAGKPDSPSQNVPPQQTSQVQLLQASNTPSPNTGTVSSGVHELPKTKKKKKKVRSGTSSQDQDLGEGFSSAYPSDTDSVTSERSTSSEKPRSYNTRAAGLLMKQPSVVREDREAEEQEESGLPAKKMNGQLGKNGIMNGATPANTSKVLSQSPQSTRAAGQVETPKIDQRSSLDVPGTGRHQSLSPARSTHFSSHPEYETPDGVKHQPPARSVSPAKSALKHSPSRGQSPIGSLPTSRRAGFAGSEASDTASNISDEGARSVTKKKKARVSFDDDMVAIGRAASPPMSPDSPVLMSPQNKPKGRSWFDLVREKKQEEALIESDHDTVIKPTPTLPSFGSLRRDRAGEVVPDAGRQQKPSSDHAQNALRGVDTSSDQVVSGIIAQDAATKAQGQPAQSSDPLPPEVTSVEGSGYHSDDEANITDEQEESSIPKARDEASTGAPVSVTNEDVPPLEATSEALRSPEQDPSVPLIALQPATPALETGSQEQKGWLGMPGEFPDSTEASDSIGSRPVPSTENRSPVVVPVSEGAIEPENEAKAALNTSKTSSSGEVSAGLPSQIDEHSSEESDDTGASIYSDAAEDPDNLDGDGFGSINAIVESPAQSPVVPVASKSPPASPSMRSANVKTTKPSPLTRQESELSEPTSEEGWDRAQAYWSGLSQERKRQLEQAAVPGALDERVLPNKTMRGPDSVRKKKKKAQKKSASPPDSRNLPLPPWPDKQYRGEVSKAPAPVAPPLKSSLRKSQNGESQEPLIRTSFRTSQGGGGAQEPRMRSSMRNGVPPKSSLVNDSQRNSMQLPVSEPRGALQKKIRPTSAVAMVDYNKAQAAPAAAHMRASSAGNPSSSLTPVLAQPKKKTPSQKPVLNRNDSDSSSSFKKERRSTSASGKYTMKRTMRPSSADTRGPAGRGSSLNARNSSPAGPPAARPFSAMSSGGGGMRTSMRDSAQLGGPAARTSLRESSDSKMTKSQSRFGFGKSAKPKSADSKPSSRFSSRFADSSDDEDILPSRNSRFAGSSDEEPSHLTPVRGIPRRIDEGDSTDLEDSSVENTTTPSKLRTNGTKPSLDTKPEGVALASGSLRVASGDKSTAAMGAGLQAKKAAEKDKKKRSFFGGLGSKRRDDPSRVRKADVESSARRDTPLERSKTERLLTTGSSKDERILGPSSPQADPVSQTNRPVINSRTSSAQNSPKSPKLQRRNTPKRLTSANDISWPLSQGPNGTSDSRPRTSDGPAVSSSPNGAGRPELGVRRTTVQGAPPPPTAPLVVGGTEKKKRFGMLRKAFGMQS